MAVDQAGHPAGPERPASLAAMLRGHRQRALLSQEELAKRSGVSVSTIASLEAGRNRRPRGGSVRLLADALSLDPQQRAALITAAQGNRAGPETRGGAARAGAGGPPVPAQLPADLAAFTGRADELRHLGELLPGDPAAYPEAMVIAAIAGTAGVGKTALAVHWAHRVADRFPDGQLYLNLRGFDPTAPPTDSAEAVRGFLGALAVPPHLVPAGLDAQIKLYRSVLAGRRVMVVLDNARDAEHVRPLLPGTSGCLVIVTSRSQLTSLVATEAAHLLTLDLPSTPDARQLLARRLGGRRVAAEPEAVHDIIDRCARLPLALAVVAARAAAQPTFPLARFATTLRSATAGLDALAAGDAATDVRAVFSWSYRILSPPAARLFRLLSLHPGPDIGGAAAASLASVGPGQAAPLLAELTRANLITEHMPDRYAVHDLLRTYASELAHSQDPEPDRRAATHRLLAHYLQTAYTAACRLNPHRLPITLVPPPAGVTPEQPRGHDGALAWFAREQATLLAAITLASDAGFEPYACQLAWSVAEFLDRLGQWHDQRAVQATAVAAAARLGDGAKEAIARRFLGSAHIQLNQPTEAEVHLRRALDLFGTLGDLNGQASTLVALTRLHERQGDYRQALVHAHEAVERYRRIGHRAGQAGSLNGVGWLHARLEEYDQTLAYCGEALALHEEVGNWAGAADTWDSLGYAHHHLGDLQQAITCFERAVEGFSEAGIRYQKADALIHLGDAHLAAGAPGSARAAWQQALDILEDLDHPDADQLRDRLREAGGGR